MIKVSSRFLAVLMLAVLAFTDVTTTSAFAGGFFRSAPSVGRELRHQSDSLRPGRVENPDVMHPGLSGDTWLVNPPPQEKNSQGLRPYPYVDPVMVE
jgi:hypothetical protein